MQMADQSKAAGAVESDSAVTNKTSNGQAPTEEEVKEALQY